MESIILRNSAVGGRGGGFGDWATAEWRRGGGCRCSCWSFTSSTGFVDAGVGAGVTTEAVASIVDGEGERVVLEVPLPLSATINGGVVKRAKELPSRGGAGGKGGCGEVCGEKEPGGLGIALAITAGDGAEAPLL